MIAADVFKYNDNHDEQGRFSSGDGGGDRVPTADGRGSHSQVISDFLDNLHTPEERARLIEGTPPDRSLMQRYGMTDSEVRAHNEAIVGPPIRDPNAKPPVSQEELRAAEVRRTAEARIAARLGQGNTGPRPATHDEAMRRAQAEVIKHNAEFLKYNENHGEDGRFSSGGDGGGGRLSAEDHQRIDDEVRAALGGNVVGREGGFAHVEGFHTAADAREAIGRLKAPGGLGDVLHVGRGGGSGRTVVYPSRGGGYMVGDKHFDTVARAANQVMKEQSQRLAGWRNSAAIDPGPKPFEPNATKSMYKYSDDQARDPDGRFAGGGDKEHASDPTPDHQSREIGKEAQRIIGESSKHIAMKSGFLGQHVVMRTKDGSGAQHLANAKAKLSNAGWRVHERGDGATVAMRPPMFSLAHAGESEGMGHQYGTLGASTKMFYALLAKADFFKFNPNHGEHGLFSSGPGGSDEPAPKVKTDEQREAAARAVPAYGTDTGRAGANPGSAISGPRISEGTTGLHLNEQQQAFVDRSVKEATPLAKALDDFSKKGASYRDEANAGAKELLVGMQDKAQRTLDDLNKVAGAHQAAMLQDSEKFMVKSEGSLTRKIDGKMDTGMTKDQAKEAIGDAMRYTMMFDHEDLGTRGQEVLDHLRSIGYDIPDKNVENSWVKGEGYKGVNIDARTPDGQRFELQFHTPESLKLKEEIMHPMYEVSRAPDKALLAVGIKPEAIGALRSQMKAAGSLASGAIDHPPNLGSLGVVHTR